MKMGLLRFLDYNFKEKKSASSNKSAMAATIVNLNPEAYSAPFLKTLKKLNKEGKIFPIAFTSWFLL